MVGVFRSWSNGAVSLMGLRAHLSGKQLNPVTRASWAKLSGQAGTEA
jgi:hypothetical protein